MCDRDFNLKLKAGTMENISVRGWAAASNGKGERSLAVVNDSICCRGTEQELQWPGPQAAKVFTGLVLW